MADREDSGTPGRIISENRKALRKVIVDRVELQRRERHAAVREEMVRSEKDRIGKQREARFARARSRRRRQIQAANEANVRVEGHVKDASRALRGALRASTSVSLPRHSAEGRAQARVIRAIEDAMGALRRIGAGKFDEANFEIDLDLDAD